MNGKSSKQLLADRYTEDIMALARHEALMPETVNSVLYDAIVEAVALCCDYRDLMTEQQRLDLAQSMRPTGRQ